MPNKASLPHQAIFFYGSSPGAGKSTLSSFSYEQLVRHNIPVIWLYEEDVLYCDEFATFIRDIQSGNPRMLDSLLMATSAFVDSCQKAGAVAVTDSIFPCFNWLLATNLYTQAELEIFSRKLEMLLQLLQPLIVFLDVEPVAALHRAIGQRGESWFEQLMETMNGYSANRTCPLRTVADVADYFRRQAQMSLSLLREWSCPLLVLDALDTPVAQLQTLILSELQLTERPPQHVISQASLYRYMGVYRAKTAVLSVADPLEVSLSDGALIVNTYWPKGCTLIVEGEHQFRLQDTSHRIHFELAIDGSVAGLSYMVGEQVYHYERQPL